MAVARDYHIVVAGQGSCGWVPRSTLPDISLAYGSPSALSATLMALPRLGARPYVRFIGEVGDREPPAVPLPQADVDPEVEVVARQAEVSHHDWGGATTSRSSGAP